MVADDGRAQQSPGEVVPRYARRTREVDEAILGAHLADAKTRRIRKALEPLLASAPLSRSAVSPVATKLKTQFVQWSELDLSEKWYAVLFTDGSHLKVRMARRVVSVPVPVALGVGLTPRSPRKNRGDSPDGLESLVVGLGQVNNFLGFVAYSGISKGFDARGKTSREFAPPTTPDSPEGGGSGIRSEGHSKNPPEQTFSRPVGKGATARWPIS